MVQFFDNISDDHAEWIKKQKIFFVGTAPLDGRGTVNNSPKGYDCLRVLNPNQVCYLEMSGKLHCSPLPPPCSLSLSLPMFFDAVIMGERVAGTD
jgi:hypothetical protein